MEPQCAAIDANKCRRRRRRVTIAISVNAELSNQVDAWANDALLTRSRAWEQLALGAIAQLTNEDA